MAFHKLIGNLKIKNILSNCILNETLPQSLLFAGDSGIGKYQFAIAAAQALNCSEDYNIGCGNCPTCLRIETGEHPDIKIINPDGAFIKIGQIREIIGNASFNPFEGRHRIIIINDAELMNINAANSLLKILEEPPTKVFIILITPNFQKLPETVRSRCVFLRFSPLSIDEIKNYLELNSEYTAEEKNLIARICYGRPGWIKNINLPLFKTMRKEVVELIEILGNRKKLARLTAAAIYLGKKERGEFENYLNLITSVLHDTTCCLADISGDTIINIDIYSKLKELCKLFTIAQLTKILSGIEKVRRDLLYNINRTIALESLFIRIVES